ncbi:bis(5'-adenosyl)-triphosphatase enpp4-like isoform X2 [Dysidea avara]
MIITLLMYINATTASDARSSANSDSICSKPPVLHLSLDGYRYDYYKRQLNPHLQYVMDTGVRAEYMRSQYPTQTYPNHYTIITGLYPEYHGIVANKFFDKATNETFSQSDDSHWWLGEPIWVTVMKNGLVSAAYFWPGSEVEGIEPNYYLPYNKSVPFDQRVQTVLKWLDLPEEQRPQFIALYFDEPDDSGHKYGPDSVQVNNSIMIVDEAIGELLEGLKDRSILDCINFVITSDHGMQSATLNETIVIEDYVGDLTDEIQVVSVGSIVLINIYPPADKESFYLKLQSLPHAQVYYADEVPFRLRVDHNLKNRYSDIIIIPYIGWYVTTRSGYRPRSGEHGYNNNARTMWAFMTARGPAFKKGYISPSFDNIQLYYLEAALLGLEPAVTNGTFGSLYHLLLPEVVEKLPAEKAYEPQRPEVVGNCNFPMTVEELHDKLTCNDCLCPSCQYNDSQLIAEDLKLNLTTEQIIHYQSYHLFGGVPVGGGGTGSCELTDQQQVIKYSTTLHIPLWVAFRISSTPVNDVINCSRVDPRLHVDQSAKCSHFNTDGYVAGILANYGSSEFTQYYSGMVPQLKSFNQGVWQPLENKLMRWSKLYSSIYVISGSILDDNHDGMRDDDEDYNRWSVGRGSAAVATQFYSIAIRCNVSSVDISNCPVEHIDALGLVVYHNDTKEEVDDEYFQFRITSVREIEKLTDTNFFPNLTPSEQNQIELKIFTDLWEE